MTRLAAISYVPAAMLLGNVGWLSIASMMVCQLLKPLLAVRKSGRLSVGRIFDTGGMPSSHTALVTTLTLCIFEVEGGDSILFSMSLIFSLYFVFEATGLSQEVGQQAKILNRMFVELFQNHQVDRRRLKELVGHSWQEVLGGAAVGTAVYLLGRGWILTV